MFELDHAPASTTSQRIERKYPLPDTMLEETIAALHTVLPVYRYNGAEDWSSIRTTYLDTHDLQCYQEYLQALPVRRKIRVRQYGVNGRFDHLCWVEIKVKNRTVSLKRRFCCRAADLALLVKGQDIGDRVARQNETDVARIYQVIRSMILEQQLVPAVRVEYERLSFQLANYDGLRVTLDRDVRFCCPRREHQGSLTGLVVEVKHNGAKPAWLPTLQQRLGLKRVKRFSKFARSIRQLTELRECEGAR